MYIILCKYIILHVKLYVTKYEKSYTYTIVCLIVSYFILKIYIQIKLNINKGNYIGRLMNYAPNKKTAASALKCSVQDVHKKLDGRYLANVKPRPIEFMDRVFLVFLATEDIMNPERGGKNPPLRFQYELFGHMASTTNSLCLQFWKDRIWDPDPKILIKNQSRNKNLIPTDNKHNNKTVKKRICT